MNINKFSYNTGTKTLRAVGHKSVTPLPAKPRAICSNGGGSTKPSVILSVTGLNKKVELPELGVKFVTSF